MLLITLRVLNDKSRCFYSNYQISVTTNGTRHVVSTICLTIIIQLGGQKMHAGIVLSAVSVTKGPSWEV